MPVQEPKLGHYPKNVACKDKTEVTIRPMAAGDLALVRDFFTSLPREDRQFLRHDVSRPEVFSRWFEDLDYSKRLPLMALYQGKVVAHALLDGTQPNWSPHVAEIRLVVANDFKKRALGTILVRELLDQAMQRGYEKVVASVMETQTEARRMFERMNFKVEAQLKHHVKDLDGRKHDLIIMTSTLEDAWAAMEELLQDFSPWAGWA